MGKEILKCKRKGSERKLIFCWNEGDTIQPIAELWVDYEERNFWKRLVNGLRYIFGKDKGLDYIILTKEHSYQMQKVATYLKGKRKKNESNKS